MMKKGEKGGHNFFCFCLGKTRSSSDYAVKGPRAATTCWTRNVNIYNRIVLMTFKRWIPSRRTSPSRPNNVTDVTAVKFRGTALGIFQLKGIFFHSLYNCRKKCLGKGSQKCEPTSHFHFPGRGKK